MFKVTAAAAKSPQSCPTLCDPIDGGPPGSRPWDSPGENTGVGCHFRLQCVKVKSLSRVRLLATPWSAAHQAPPSKGFYGTSNHRLPFNNINKWTSDTCNILSNLSKIVSCEKSQSQGVTYYMIHLHKILKL